MIKLQVTKTTDGKFVGNTFEFPEIPSKGTRVPVGDYLFRILYVKQINENTYTFGNFNYQVTAKVVQ